MGKQGSSYTAHLQGELAQESCNEGICFPKKEGIGMDLNKGYRQP